MALKTLYLKQLTILWMHMNLKEIRKILIRVHIKEMNMFLGTFIGTQTIQWPILCLTLNVDKLNMIE